MMDLVQLGVRERDGASVEAPREDNRLRIEDRAAHDWYRFVLSFPAHLVRTYLDKFELHAGQTVLDPFCGTGTTLAECKKLGISSCGVEPNPMAAFASRTKVSWEVDPQALLKHATRVAKLTLEKFDQQGLADEGGLPLFDANRRDPTNLKTLSPELSKLLLTDSISVFPLPSRFEMEEL